MKRHTPLLILSLALVLPLNGATKTLTVLGNQKVKTSWDGDMPTAMKDRGIKTDVTGLMLNSGKLVPAFGFECTTKKKVLSVLVEDVTGTSAEKLIDDPAPEITKQRWKGNSEPRNITPTETPWIFESGNTMKVFRFTVVLESEPSPVVIYQPAVFPAKTKQMLVMMGRQKG